MLTPEQEKNFWQSLYKAWNTIPTNGEWKQIASYYKRGSEGSFKTWTNGKVWYVGFELWVDENGEVHCNYHVSKFYNEAEALAYADRVSD